MTAADTAPALRDDEPLDSDQYAQAWARARDQAERDALLYEWLREQGRQIHDLTAAIGRLTAIVSNSAQASTDMAREHSGEHKLLNANLMVLAEQARANAQAIGQLAESQGIIAAELAARARQDSVHDEAITAQHKAIEATAAEVRAVQLKTTAIRAGLVGTGALLTELARRIFNL